MRVSPPLAVSARAGTNARSPTKNTASATARPKRHLPAIARARDGPRAIVPEPVEVGRALAVGELAPRELSDERAGALRPQSPVADVGEQGPRMDLPELEVHREATGPVEVRPVHDQQRGWRWVTEPL